MGRQPDSKIAEGDTNLIYPSLDNLLKKVDSKYTLVILTSRRARELVAGDRPLVASRSKKEVTIALEEIATDKLTYDRAKPGSL